MKALTDATAQTWRASPPAAVASPWGRRPAGLWTLIVGAWRESMDVYARTGGRHFPWSYFM